ncbi:nitrate assimilation regulatory nira [Fusarium longipes]|uniref:Nitrate assimilation regulatory nira n=1 Tax=Fusarium longipes TaxID=694270 RepID=A0A395T7Y6_9HYPO|nr:nitrate assimilation regulatory nira [Fusarium longipes]
MSFRAIQPASSQSGAEENYTPLSRQSSRLPKYHNAVQACENCRKSKTKCNEERPRCSTCIRKNRQCSYKTDDKQRLISATKSRLESLERLFSNLQTSSPDEANELLQRIRASGDVNSIIAANAETTVTPSLVTASSKGSDLSTISSSLGTTKSVPTGSGTASSTQEQVRDPHRNSMEMDMNSSISGQPSPLTTSTNQSSSDQLQNPDASVTAQALDSFFSCSGKLFHVFNKDDILEYYRHVFEAEESFSESLEAKLGCIMAVAAVGAQYQSSKFSKDLRVRFYNLAKLSLDAIIEQQPLQAIKVCTLLAQYNIFDKEMVALSYVGKWFILTLCWLSSTLGYISGNDTICDTKLLTELRVFRSSDISEVIQIAMVKICILKANILRMQVAFKELTMSAIQSIRGDLQKWHQELPDAIRIEAISSADLSLEAKRSALHVHLLYFGAVMLLYRRIACQFMQSYNSGQRGNNLPIPLHRPMAEQSTEAVLVSRQSAKILKLLLEEDSVFKRCWLVIFQAYATATILLHAAIQKCLHGFNPLAWKNDLERANECLVVLAFCATDDPVAARFHKRLKAIYEEIYSLQSSYNPPDARDGFSSLDHDYLLSIPANAKSSHVNLSLNLLTMLSQPFGDEFGDPRANQRWLTDPSRYEYPQLLERLDLDYEKNIFHQWDTSKMKYASSATLGAR